MPAGDVVTLWVRSGNRDEAAFPAATTLDPRRQPNPHLAFGHGPHYCIAAELARIEVAAVLRTMVELVADVEAVARPTRLESNFFRGYDSVPVALGPASERGRVETMLRSNGGGASVKALWGPGNVTTSIVPHPPSSKVVLVVLGVVGPRVCGDRRHHDLRRRAAPTQLDVVGARSGRAR